MRCSHRIPPTIRRQAVRSISAASLCVVATSSLRAETTEDARNLFREGRALSAQGYHQAACNKFERSLRLESGAGTEFNLAECWEKLGRTASARRLYLKVAQESQKAGLDKRAQLAFERADRLLTHVSSLRLQCDGGCPQGIRVFRDGIATSEQASSEPIEVDPGAYRIEVPMASGSVWTTQAVVSPDPGIVIVTIPALGSDSSLPQPSGRQAEQLRPIVSDDQPTKAGANGRAIPPLAPLPAVKPASSDSSVVRGMLYTGVGGLVFSGVMALWLNHKNGESEAICPSNEGCSNSEIAKHDALVSDAKLLRAGVYSGLGLAVVCVSTAGLWHYLASPTKPEKSTGQVGMRIRTETIGAGSGVAVSLGGSW